MIEGWIKLHRQLRDHPWWGCERFTKMQAWIDLILGANHTPAVIFIRGNRVDIQRGQQARSLDTLARAWRWNKKTVMRFISDLEKEGMITLQKSTVITIITINKYDLYQDDEPQSTPQNGLQKDHRTDTNKNVKNEKKKNKGTHDAAKRTRKPVAISPAHSAQARPQSMETNMTIDSEPKKTPSLPKHLEPLAMYAILFGIKFESRAEWSVFINRNVRASKALSRLPIMTLATAMVLAEDHWAKREGDFEIRLSTVSGFVENVGKEQIRKELSIRRDDLIQQFHKNKILIFLPSSPREEPVKLNS